MSPHIEIDEQVWDELKSQAEPFVDTPNTVLRRLLGLDGRKSSAEADVARSGRRRGRSASARRSQRTGGGRGSRRAPAGSLLPESEYELPILQVLMEQSGRAPTREVVERVGELVADKLTELDKEPLASGDVRWQNRVQFTRLRMIEQGLLKKNSPRGTWEIAPAGEELVNQPRRAA